jgi:hypothetical protein
MKVKSTIAIVLGLTTQYVAALDPQDLHAPRRNTTMTEAPGAPVKS